MVKTLSGLQAAAFSLYLHMLKGDFIFSCVVNVPKNSKAVLPVERKINVLITFSSPWSSQPAPRQGIYYSIQFSSVQSLSRLRLFATP